MVSINEKCFLRKNRAFLRSTLDVLALCVVMHYAAFRFLQQSTMFPLVYTERYKYFIIISLIAVGSVRFCFVFLEKLMSLENQRLKSQLFFKCAITGCLALPFFYVGLKHDYKSLVFLPLTALCLYDMDAKRILRWFVWTTGVLIAGTLICCYSGTIRNLINEDPISGRISICFGFINSTDFASYFTFLFLFIWCLQKPSGWLANLLLASVIGLFGFWVYQNTSSKTSLFCCVLTVLAILWECLDRMVLQKTAKLRRVGKIVNRFSVFAFPVLFAALLIVSIGYLSQAPWALRIDSLLSGRIGLSVQAYEQYGIHAFGSLIENMNGFGRTIMRIWHTNGYGYLDIAYAHLIIRYGWVITLVVMGLWGWMTVCALKQGASKIAFAMAIISFHALSETHFFDVNYNIFLVMPFCSFIPTATETTTETLSDPNQSNKDIHWFGLFTALAIGVGIYFSLPFSLSWLRTIYRLEVWTEGIHTLPSFIVSTVLAILIIGIWKGLNLLWYTREKKSWVLFSVSILLMGAVLFAGNTIIQKGLIDQEERLTAEEKVIHLVQTAAEQPVYTADASELYQRRFGGFDRHIFTSGELSLSQQGTIFTDASVELLGVTRSEGQYAQISPWSGLYTYDRRVIEALTEAGYMCRTFYYTERSCDLKDLAVRNALDMSQDGGLILNGSVHSLSNNLEWDQFYGEYAVRFTLSLPKNTPRDYQGTLCTLLIAGESNQNTIAEQALSLADFDENGKCIFTLTYKPWYIANVSYLISVTDGVEIILEDLSWRIVPS